MTKIIWFLYIDLIETQRLVEIAIVVAKSSYYTDT